MPKIVSVDESRIMPPGVRILKVTLSEAMVMVDAPGNQQWREFQVDYPEARQGRYAIQRYSIGQHEEHRLARVVNEGIDRDTGWGEFRRLVEEAEPGQKEDDDNWFTAKRDGKRYLLWMSDTRAEILEHAPMLSRLWQAKNAPPGSVRVLINGLGLGIIARAAAAIPGVGHVDVVDINPDIVQLITPLIHSPKIHIHVADAYSIKWPKDTRWDLAWHDIWPDIAAKNLAQMNRLERKYAHRVSWQASWQRDGCEMMADDEQRMANGTMPMNEALEKYLRMSGRLGRAVAQNEQYIPEAFRRAK
jgi:hypothetical protein